MRRAALAWMLALGWALLVPVATRADEISAVDAARTKVAAGDTAGALRDLDGYVPAHPADVPAARLLGDLYFRVPDYKRAEAVWKTIVARNPGDRETHNRLGSLYAVLDRIPDAIAEFEKSLPSRGGFAGLVDQHRRKGDLAQFESQFAFFAEQHPLDAGAQSYYAHILRAQRKYAEAQIPFSRVVSLQPNECGALVDSGNNLIDLGRLADAIALFNRCLAREPNFYAALVDLGEAYIEKDQLAGARSFFERALAVRPDGPEALVDVGFLEDAAGRWKTAVGYYLRAIASEPLQAEAYIDLGYDYNEHQLYQLAEATFLKGISVAPEEGRLHYMLAVTYNVQGKVRLARDQYRLAINSREPIVVRAAQQELALLPPA